MAYYGVDEMKSILSDYAQYRDKLYCRGFLITDRVDIPMDEYPFYGNWDTKCIAVDDENSLYIICHRQTKSYIYNDGNAVHFIIGHAYNPYQMESDEEVILDGLSKALRNSIYEYWEKESELTGVFCVGFIRNNQITFSTDCAGMQLVYYGKDKENFFISSHSKLVADLCGFLQDEYITRLVNSRFYKYWGTFLPGECRRQNRKPRRARELELRTYPGACCGVPHGIRRAFAWRGCGRGHALRGSVGRGPGGNAGRVGAGPR